MAPNFLPKLLAFCVAIVSASVTVRKTGRAPTGYEVDFYYVNTTASSVIIGGGLQPFTDQYHISAGGTAKYDPHNYKPGDFYVTSDSASDTPYTPYIMQNCGDGAWTYTTPLPSGTYIYAFLVDCDYAPNCTINTGEWVIDKDNPPFENVAGDQVSSVFQVPFDPVYQYYDEMNLNFDYTLPVDPKWRGTVKNVNYTSPGSTHPAPNVHDFILYLPKEYGTVPGRQYPLLYLQHGSTGNAGDWENICKASQILDNLIMRGYMEPTVVVMPTLYNLNANSGTFVRGSSANNESTLNPSPSSVIENYMEFLFPWVESHYNVSPHPSRRAFAGLSMGAVLTYNMWISQTDYFDYYGMFSGAAGPFANQSDPASYLTAEMLAAKPALAQKGIYTTVGAYDQIAFVDSRSFQDALELYNVSFLTRLVPFGTHYWNTWQDALWHMGRVALWQPTPFTNTTSRNLPYPRY